MIPSESFFIFNYFSNFFYLNIAPQVLGPTIPSTSSPFPADTTRDGIIFQNYNGHYLTPSIIRETIRDYCKKAGVEYKGTHVFRHTHAVLLLESGASLKYVSNRLGHKTIKTTADTYLDITEKIEEDELQKFASYTKR